MLSIERGARSLVNRLKKATIEQPSPLFNLRPLFLANYDYKVYSQYRLYWFIVQPLDLELVHSTAGGFCPLKNRYFFVRAQIDQHHFLDPGSRKFLGKSPTYIYNEDTHN